MRQTLRGISVKTLSKLLQMTKHAVGSNSDIKKTCRQCGKVVTARWRRVYCSQECSVVGNRKHYRKWRADNLEKSREINRRSEERRREKTMVARGDIKRTCRHCGRVITHRRRKAYCSQACSVVGNMERYRKWRADNLEKAREIGRQRYWNNVEKARENYRMRKKNNPERIREISRRWYRNNKEKASETQRRWYQNNSDKVKKDAIQWQKDNPEKVREIDRRKREKRRRKAMEAAVK